jgi:hypothetical protein
MMHMNLQQKKTSLDQETMMIFRPDLLQDFPQGLHPINHLNMHRQEQQVPLTQMHLHQQEGPAPHDLL